MHLPVFQVHVRRKGCFGNPALQTPHCALRGHMLPCSLQLLLSPPSSRQWLCVYVNTITYMSMCACNHSGVRHMNATCLVCTTSSSMPASFIPQNAALGGATHPGSRLASRTVLSTLALMLPFTQSVPGQHATPQIPPRGKDSKLVSEPPENCRG